MSSFFWLLVTGFALSGWRFEVGGLNILPFSLKPQTSRLKPRRRLPLSRVGHRADQQQATGSQLPETSDQLPGASDRYPETYLIPSTIEGKQYFNGTLQFPNMLTLCPISYN